MKIHAHSQSLNYPPAHQEAGKTANKDQNTTFPKPLESDSSKNTSKNFDDNKSTSEYNNIHNELNKEELEKIQELKQRDLEVRNHEAAHLAAAGQYATSGAKFQYQRGPDGKNYAVGGEVSIDTSAIPNNPEATIKKAQQIQAAAHAPAAPSNQDRQVAAQASKLESEARMELAEQRQTNINKSGEENKTSESENVGNNQHNAIKAYEETSRSNPYSTNNYLNYTV